MHIQEVGPGRYRFHTIIPRRYGATGMVPGHGLFLNGLWHPQPVRGGRPEIVDWNVRVQSRRHHGRTERRRRHRGVGVVRYDGASRPRGHPTRPAGTPGHCGRVAHARLQSTTTAPTRLARGGIVDSTWTLPEPIQLVVVEAPMRRRLVRMGPGVLFVSDRALRLTAGLWQFHVAALQRGILGSALGIVDPFERAFAATAIAADHEPEIDLRESLGWLSWIPEVDSLLYDGRLPSTRMPSAKSGPPTPSRTTSPRSWTGPPSPGAHSADRHHLRRWNRNPRGWRPRRGRPGPGASACRHPRRRAPGRRPWPPAQELSVSVTPSGSDGAIVEVVRSGPPSLPAEPIVVKTDEERHLWLAPPGPGAHRIELGQTPSQVVLDPDGTVHQPARHDDRWPRPLTLTAAFFPYELNLRGGGLSAAAWMSVRRQFSTRWRFDGSLQTSPSDIIGGTIGAVRYLGPLQDRRNRPLRLSFGGGPSLLDPDFRPVGDQALSIDGYASIAWDTRVDRIFPRRGHRLYLGGSGGIVPGETAWSRAGISGVWMVPLGGRVALATRGGGAIATGDVAHRLLQLGGSGNVQGLRPDLALGTARFTSTAELRWQALRQVSVPMPLMWLSDLQLHGGIDAGTIRVDRRVWVRFHELLVAGRRVVGGALGTADVLGARPTSLGVGCGTTGQVRRGNPISPSALHPAHAGILTDSLGPLWVDLLPSALVLALPDDGEHRTTTVGPRESSVPRCRSHAAPEQGRFSICGMS